MTIIKRTHCWREAWCIALLTACTLLLWPVTALALTKCVRPATEICADLGTTGNQDCDGDGFTNSQECTFVNTVTNKTLYYYQSTDVNATSANKVLDPSNADLFYLLTDMSEPPNDLTSGLLYDAMDKDPLKNALKFYANGLFYMRTHLLTSDYCGTDRLLITTPTTVRAARFKEQTLAGSGTDIGKTQPLRSSPSTGGAFSIIYTTRIKNGIDANCKAGNPTCSISGTNLTSVNGANNDALIRYYILQVVAHEMGHGSQLGATGYTDAYGHYTKSSTIMKPTATFSRGVYVIPTAFDPNRDFNAVSLIQ